MGSLLPVRASKGIDSGPSKMASAWGDSWGNAWGNAWGEISQSVSSSSGGTTDAVTNERATAPPSPNYLICDRTGFKVPVEEGLKKEWTGAMVRKESWEPRHPQDLVRAKIEKEQKGSPRPEQQDEFIEDRYTNGEVTVNDLG